MFVFLSALILLMAQICLQFILGWVGAKSVQEMEEGTTHKIQTDV